VDPAYDGTVGRIEGLIIHRMSCRRGPFLLSGKSSLLFHNRMSIDFLRFENLLF
jgi:hypothetical protein